MTIRCTPAWLACWPTAAGSTRLSRPLAGVCAGAVEECTIGEAKAQLETNFWGCVRVVQQVLPAMRAQRGGRIVLMSSIGGVIGIPFQAFYSASKFALEGLGEALAYEVAPLGVHVTLVEPGNVKTDFTASRRMAAAGGDPAYRAALTKAVGLMERDEANGVPAADVAAVVRRVLESGRPPEGIGRQGERASGPAGQAAAAVPRLRGRCEKQPGSLTSSGA